MRKLNSLIMVCADETKVPAGGALAVDREGFSAAVTKKIKENPKITIIEKEVDKLNPDEYTIVAAGPLVSEVWLKKFTDLLVRSICIFMTLPRQ